MEGEAGFSTILEQKQQLKKNWFGVEARWILLR
jgi:hypothetical protein